MGCKSNAGLTANKKNIKPIPWPQRQPIPLIVGQDYFIAYGPKRIRHGELIGFIDRGDERWVRVATEKGIRTVYADEVGRTIEEALSRVVTD